ncbi:hypothetical protein [Burkholderia pseudomallei]|uniref:hypothetical protein n=1 Tax=Burkholderia pseudomallei TaxID=28450 RepID=UPI00050D9972|nr:hypothetical protein [Burkholderia pseudomallei]KGC49616.1 putative lipoprotein [Burkholderia pseudomallei]KGC65122.1 putative lipoprotein [Burkholderia pseudomallei]KGU71577.1 putative lipoprotein [Burkholderia pseudomallei MSHR4304]KGV13238.1 putative lipoprotein [Burkholderia pseudomallei MSHR4300]KGV29439.1 putative lipoprotein [Burkholderia pseudomallei MSHR4308]
MRQRLTAPAVVVVAALCVAPLVAACSDDASHANAGAGTSPAAQPGGAANAFNGGATAAGNASASAPLATPVIHYPPEDAADDASGAAAGSAQSASHPG